MIFEDEMQADTGFADALARAGMEGVEEGDAILVQRAAARTAGLEADRGEFIPGEGMALFGRDGQPSLGRSQIGDDSVAVQVSKPQLGR